MPEPGGLGGATGRSVNPIPTGEGRLSPSITTGTPNFFQLPASMQFTHSRLSLFDTVNQAWFGCWVLGEIKCFLAKKSWIGEIIHSFDSIDFCGNSIFEICRGSYFRGTCITFVATAK